MIEHTEQIEHSLVIPNAIDPGDILTFEQLSISAFLTDLKAATIDVLALARVERGESETLAAAAIAWDDATCGHAEAYINENAQRGYRVFITGATLAGSAFRQYISDKLRQVGIADIEVITAW